MKMSYRDKVILIVLLVILVWVIGVMYFIKPKLDDLDAANKEYDAAVLTLESKKAEIEADKNLKERVNEAYDRVIKLCDVFYDQMTSDEVSTKIDTLLDDDKIENDSLTISAYSATTLDTVDPSAAELVTDFDRIAKESRELGQTVDLNQIVSEVEGASGPVPVPSYTVSFGFKCKLDDLKNFLDNLIGAEHKSLVVTDCSIDDVSEDEVTGQATMVLMMMPRIANPIAADEAAS